MTPVVTPVGRPCVISSAFGTRASDRVLRVRAHPTWRFRVLSSGTSSYLERAHRRKCCHCRCCDSAETAVSVADSRVVACAPCSAPGIWGSAHHVPTLLAHMCAQRVAIPATPPTHDMCLNCLSNFRLFRSSGVTVTFLTRQFLLVGQFGQ